MPHAQTDNLNIAAFDRMPSPDEITRAVPLSDAAAKVVLDAPDENRQALVDYLSQSAGSKINPSADGNWRIAPTGTVEPTFLSSSNAARFLAQHPGIRLVKDNGDGSAVYGLKP